MSWREFTLSEILKRRKNHIKLAPDQDYKLVTIKLYHKGVVLRSVVKGETIKSPMSVVSTGDFVLSGIDARNGAFGIVPAELEGAIITNDFWSLEPDESIIDKEFLLFLTSTDFFDRICKESSDGTTQRIRLQASRFFSYKITLPYIDEQKEILKKLKDARQLGYSVRGQLTHQLSLVKQLRQAFLREAMQGKLVPQNPADEPASELLRKIKAEKEQLIKDKKLKKEKPLPPIKPEEIPFEIPENWVWCRLGEIASNVEYGTSEKAEMSAEHIPVLRMNNIQDGKIQIEKLKYVKSSIDDLPRLFLKKDDLLFNRTNSWELVGKTGVYKGESDKMTFASYLIRVQFSKNIIVDFLSRYINSSFCRTTQLEPNIIKQNGQANFNGSKLRNIICPLPPLPEQLRIVQKLEQLMQLCDGLEQSITQSQQQNEMLLQQVLREALEPKENVEPV